MVDIAGPAEQCGPSTRETAFLELFEANYRDMCRLATLLLSDPHRAEDMVQEAFLRTYSGWGKLRHPERADAYVRRSVVNLCRSGLRHRLVETRGNARAAGQPQLPGWDGDGTGTSIAVLHAVRALPTRQRTAVVLRYYADLSQSDMAETMGCSVGTVKSQLAKARAALSRSLGEGGSGGEAEEP